LRSTLLKFISLSFFSISAVQKNVSVRGTAKSFDKRVLVFIQTSHQVFDDTNLLSKIEAKKHFQEPSTEENRIIKILKTYASIISLP